MNKQRATQNQKQKHGMIQLKPQGTLEVYTHPDRWSCVVTCRCRCTSLEGRPLGALPTLQSTLRVLSWPLGHRKHSRNSSTGTCGRRSDWSLHPQGDHETKWNGITQESQCACHNAHAAARMPQRACHSAHATARMPQRACYLCY